MSSVKKSSSGKHHKADKVKPDRLELELPTDLSEISDEFEEYTVFVHGEKKIGKTTLAMASAEKTFLLTFDPLQKSYALLQRHCPSWKHLKEYISLLEKAAAKGKYPYQRIVVDGADIMHKRCQKHACKMLGINHPSEEDWGKGWDAVNTEFADLIDRILALPGGKWFISHSTWKEVETRRGKKIEKLVPLMGARAEELLVGKLDAWFAYDYNESDRVLVVRGDERVAAGSRIKGHFLTPGGRSVKEVPMGDSEEEAWENLIAAFENRQKFITLEEREEQAEKAKKKSKKG